MYEILAIALKKKEKLIWHKDKEQVLHAIEIKKYTLAGCFSMWTLKSECFTLEQHSFHSVG